MKLMKAETATLVGAFMCFRKQDYEQLEGLDERYFMYGEDIDLSYQFTKAGYQNYYLGTESILHFKGKAPLEMRFILSVFLNRLSCFLLNITPILN